MWRCDRNATFHLSNGRHIRNIFSCAEAQPDIAGWSSLVARRAHNPEVVGSNPAPATKNLQLGGLMASEFFFVPIGLDIHQDVRIQLRRPPGTLPDDRRSDQPLGLTVHSISLMSRFTSLHRYTFRASAAALLPRSAFPTYSSSQSTRLRCSMPLWSVTPMRSRVSSVLG